MRLLIHLGFALAASAASAITIDDFTTTYTNSVQNGTWVDSHNAAVLGGERDLQFTVVSNPSNQFADMDLQGTGVGVFSNGFGMTSIFTLQYDGVGDEVANTGPGKVLKNGGTGGALLPKGTDRICIGWLGNDLPVQTTVTARLSGNVLSTAVYNRPAASGAGLVFLSLANLDMADSISFEFAGVIHSDFALSSLKAVPEPASLTALAAASLLFLVRRKR